jgi:hypothetical protein
MASDVKEIQTRGAYEATVPLGTLLEDARQIERMLDEIATRRKILRVLAGVAFVAGLVLLAVSNGLVAACAGLAIVFGVALFIYSFIAWSGLLNGRDRIAVMKDLSEKLRHDADARSPFSVRLALKSQPKTIGTGPWKGRNKGTQHVTEEDFLTLQGKLLDGTVIMETVKELTRKRTYRNSNHKSKTKVRQRYLATVRFSYPDKVYGDARPASEALRENIKIPGFAALRGTRVTEKAIVLKAMVDNKVDVGQTAAMLSLGAYRILNLARRYAASAS